MEDRSLTMDRYGELSPTNEQPLLQLLEATPLVLRVHHLLCLHGFQGAGYSQAFVANMHRVKKALGQSSMTVEVCLGPDAICYSCPHLTTRPACSSEGGTERDRAVAAALEIVPGIVRPWGWWVERVARAMSPSRLTEICQDCHWYPLGYCLAGIQELCRTWSRRDQT